MWKKRARRRAGLLTVAMLLTSAATAFPCTVVRVPTPSEIVADADLIVRARAEGHAAAHGHSDDAFTETSWQIRFGIAEVLKGRSDADEVVFNGELVENDDWNDRPVPYDFIRAGGRKGNCHALEYRMGAEYLLLLRKSAASATAFARWTPYWSALTPTNEQVRGKDDPWVQWVRNEVQRQGPDTRPQDPPGTDDSDTLLGALTRSGFQDASQVAGAPDLRRKVTRSAFKASIGAFASAYYFVDEMSGTRLGELHVSLFDRSRQQWIHAANVSGDAGSIMNVDVGRAYVIVDTHAAPAAAIGLVFRRSDLVLVGRVNGFFLQEMPGPLVRHTADVPAAGTHQSHLMVFNPATGANTEVFPGRREPKPGAAGGPFRGIAHSADGQRIAFVVDYGRGVSGRGGFGNLEAVVACAFVKPDEWSCEEHEVRAFAQAAGVPLAWNTYRRIADPSVHAIVQAALNRVGDVARARGRQREGP